MENIPVMSMSLQYRTFYWAQNSLKNEDREVPIILRHGGCNARHFIGHQSHRKMRPRSPGFLVTFIGKGSPEVVIIPNHSGFTYDN